MRITKEVCNIVTIIEEKRSLNPPDRSLLVAVSGIDGLGKGYITEKIISRLNERSIRAIAIITAAPKATDGTSIESLAGYRRTLANLLNFDQKL